MIAHNLTSELYDITIIGGGVAGLSAALYAGRDGFNVCLVEGDYISNTEMPGGALMLTSDIQNYPGYLEGSGGNLIEVMRTQASKFVPMILTEQIVTARFSSDPEKPHEFETNQGTVIRSKAAILATGAVSRRLDVPGEDELFGKGVSTCATCDGFFFQQKNVYVVGGGDTAVEDALFLTRYTPNVTMVVRGDRLRGSGPEVRHALTKNQDPDDTFRILWNTKVVEVHGETTVTGLSLQNDETVFNVSADGLFVAVGREPSTQFLTGTGVELDDEGYIVLNPGTQQVPGFPGVYAAGDAVDKKFRQAVTSAGRAVEAALEAREWLLK